MCFAIRVVLENASRQHTRVRLCFPLTQEWNINLRNSDHHLDVVQQSPEQNAKDYGVVYCDLTSCDNNVDKGCDRQQKLEDNQVDPMKDHSAFLPLEDFSVPIIAVFDAVFVSIVFFINFFIFFYRF